MNTESLLVPFEYRDYLLDVRRYYEVYVCLDCGALLNYGMSGDEITMKPLEIVQMFVDLREVMEHDIREIMDDAKSMLDLIEGMTERMPKQKPIVEGNAAP